MLWAVLIKDSDDDRRSQSRRIQSRASWCDRHHLYLHIHLLNTQQVSSKSHESCSGVWIWFRCSVWVLWLTNPSILRKENINRTKCVIPPCVPTLHPFIAMDFFILFFFVLKKHCSVFWWIFVPFLCPCSDKRTNNARYYTSSKPWLTALGWWKSFVCVHAFWDLPQSHLRKNDAVFAINAAVIKPSFPRLLSLN